MKIEVEIDPRQLAASLDTASLEDRAQFWDTLGHAYQQEFLSDGRLQSMVRLAQPNALRLFERLGKLAAEHKEQMRRGS